VLSEFHPARRLQRFLQGSRANFMRLLSRVARAFGHVSLRISATQAPQVEAPLDLPARGFRSSRSLGTLADSHAGPHSALPFEKSMPMAATSGGAPCRTAETMV